MPPLRAVLVKALLVHGGDINSVLLIQINGREEDIGGEGGRLNHLEEVKDLRVINWKYNWIPKSNAGQFLKEKKKKEKSF